MCSKYEITYHKELICFIVSVVTWGYTITVQEKLNVLLELLAVLVTARFVKRKLKENNIILFDRKLMKMITQYVVPVSIS